MQGWGCSLNALYILVFFLQYLVAEGGKIEMAATCGMVAGYDGFSLRVEMLIDVGIKAWV